MDEKRLVKQAMLGDKAAFAQLYTLYKDDLYRYAYFRLSNEDDAQDAVSSCIIAAYEGISTLRNEKTFRAWIFRILFRVCCASVSRQIEQRKSAPLEELSGVRAEESGFVAAELNEALSSLDPVSRDIVLLSVVAGYNSKEIAKMTGMPAGTVRSRLSRSLSKLKAFLE